MLQSAIDSFAYVAPDSLQVFFICNLIILAVLVSSLKTGPDDDQPRNLCFQPAFESRTSCHSDLPGREVSIFVKEYPRVYSGPVMEDEKLRSVKVPQPQVPGETAEASEADTFCAYENSLSISEALPAEEKWSSEDDDLLRIGGVSCYDICSQNKSHETDGHVEEDEQFRKRVEAFISKVNNGLRDEMMQTTTQYAGSLQLVRNAA